MSFFSTRHSSKYKVRGDQEQAILSVRPISKDHISLYNKVWRLWGVYGFYNILALTFFTIIFEPLFSFYFTLLLSIISLFFFFLSFFFPYLSHYFGIMKAFFCYVYMLYLALNAGLL